MFALDRDLCLAEWNAPFAESGCTAAPGASFLGCLDAADRAPVAAVRSEGETPRNTASTLSLLVSVFSNYVLITRTTWTVMKIFRTTFDALRTNRHLQHPTFE